MPRSWFTLVREFGDTACNCLPGLDTFLVPGKRQRTDLFGNINRSFAALCLEDLVSTGPEFPVAEHQPSQLTMPAMVA